MEPPPPVTRTVAVDDDPTKLNQTIHGVPVKGTLEDIPDLCKRYGIHSIIIAIPTLKGSKLNHVIDLCVSTHCAVQLLSDPQLHQKLIGAVLVDIKNKQRAVPSGDALQARQAAYF